MFYGRFKNDICLPNIDQDVCILKYITYLHEMSLHPYRPRFLQLSMTKGIKTSITQLSFPIKISKQHSYVNKYHN